jgi:hypothetical protein
MVKENRRTKILTLMLSCLGLFMVLLDFTIVNNALPSIQRHLGASLSGLQWIIDAYHGFWALVARRVMARPVISLLVATGILAVAAVPLVGIKTGFSGISVIVQSFTREPESWYVYPLLALGLAVWLAFVGLVGGLACTFARAGWWS